MIKLIRSIITEYGIGWTINRLLYAGKLKMMAILPVTEKFFEKKVFVKRVDMFDFDLPSISAFLSHLDEAEKADVITKADEGLEGIITGFSSIKLDYGQPMDWHMNPLTGVTGPSNVKWYKIPDFDQSLGDIKVVWEASRLTHFLYFARAYMLTGDAKYYKAFSMQLKDWLKHNPYGYGANFKCGQEASLRMVNVLMAYSVFLGYNLADQTDEDAVKLLVEGSYKKVLSNFFYAHKCIKNNHTFTEILGMIVGAWCCEDFKRVRKGYTLMDKEIESQFMSDGGFSQYSFNYHRFTLQIIECLYKVSHKTGVSIAQSELIKKSVLQLFQVQTKNGDLPNYGSNDGALIFPLTTCGYRDYRPVLGTIYGLIEGKRLYDYGPYDEEMLWFIGERHMPVARVYRVPSNFMASGFFTLRHKDGFVMTYAQDYKTRPAHMDQLHLELWHKGINIFCDAGTYSYASDLGKYLASTAGHNTAVIPDLDQMNKKGAFMVMNWTKREKMIYNHKQIQGTIVSQNGYRHTRIIKHAEFGYKIMDKVKADRQTCTFLFHTPCDVQVEDGGFGLVMAGETIAFVSTEGKIHVEESYRSLYYLRKETLRCVVVTLPFVNKTCLASFDIRL